MLGGSSHSLHEKWSPRDVLIPSPVENPWSRVRRLGAKIHKFLKALVGATGIEPVTPPV
jgi:hypothetical protein